MPSTFTSPVMERAPSFYELVWRHARGLNCLFHVADSHQAFEPLQISPEFAGVAAASDVTAARAALEQAEAELKAAELRTMPEWAALELAEREQARAKYTEAAAAAQTIAERVRPLWSSAKGWKLDELPKAVEGLDPRIAREVIHNVTTVRKLMIDSLEETLSSDGETFDPSQYELPPITSIEEHAAEEIQWHREHVERVRGRLVSAEQRQAVAEETVKALACVLSQFEDGTRPPESASDVLLDYVRPEYQLGDVPRDAMLSTMSYLVHNPVELTYAEHGDTVANARWDDSGDGAWDLILAVLRRDGAVLLPDGTSAYEIERPDLQRFACEVELRAVDDRKPPVLFVIPTVDPIQAPAPAPTPKSPNVVVSGEAACPNAFYEGDGSPPECNSMCRLCNGSGKLPILDFEVGA